MIAMSKRSLIFVLIGVAVLVYYVTAAILIWSYKHQPNATYKSKLIIMESMIRHYHDDEYHLSNDDITIKDKARHDYFDDLTKDDNLRKICVLGIKLLHNYLHNHDSDDLTTVRNIVDKVLTQTGSRTEGETLDADKWELYIVDIPHFMAMYYLIVKDDSSNTARLTHCYEYINSVINSNMESTCLNSTPSKTDFIKIGAPYLLTNYIRSLEDENCLKLYEKARKNNNLELLNKYLSYDTSDEVKEIYGVLSVDGETKLKSKPAEALKCFDLMNKTIKYKDMYIAVYNTLDVPGNLWKSLLNLFEIIQKFWPTGWLSDMIYDS
ncbi:GSCOCT00014148001.2-RA-CDS [Cotesia congregata]|uniref:Cc_odve66_26 n=1 Tax=Cotesia congregata TaxID=51543 RepID=A0A8J2EF47_COTCN|nr:GSCOCT00014148001.2-RA-CDS [Cotesia congregata]CAG5077192.1 Cc_odve66_26 [Cotesia congregata]